MALLPDGLVEEEEGEEEEAEDGGGGEGGNRPGGGCLMKEGVASVQRSPFEVERYTHSRKPPSCKNLLDGRLNVPRPREIIEDALAGDVRER